MKKIVEDTMIGAIAVLIIFFTILLVIGGGVGIGILCQIPHVNVFNRAYDTNYTAWEWYFAEDTIRDYIGVGKVQRLNVGLEVAQ